MGRQDIASGGEALMREDESVSDEGEESFGGCEAFIQAAEDIVRAVKEDSSWTA